MDETSQHGELPFATDNKKKDHHQKILAIQCRVCAVAVSTAKSTGAIVPSRDFYLFAPRPVIVLQEGHGILPLMATRICWNATRLARAEIGC
jgi:hypothetical protein